MSKLDTKDYDTENILEADVIDLRSLYNIISNCNNNTANTNSRVLNRYILDSVVITAPGSYTYELLTVKECEKLLRSCRWICAIGYEEIVRVLNNIFETDYKVNELQISMLPGEEAIVFRLKKKLGNEEKQRRLSEKFIRESLEIGLLRRVS